MKKLLQSLCLGAVLLGPVAHAEQVVRVGTLADYAPFEYKDASGKLQGMEIDIGKTMCDEMKVRCQWVTMDFDALIPALKAKQIDAVLAQMSKTPEREQSVDFTRIFTTAPVQLVAKQGSGVTDNPAALHGKTIGVQTASTHESYLRRRLPTNKSGINVKVYQTLDEAWLDLEAGRIDAVFADSTVAYDWLSKTGKKDGFDFVGKPIADAEIFGEGTAIAVRKGDAPMKAMFDRSIAQVQTDGTFSTVNKRYFPFSIAP
ncbi:transporter substrate-binding domain-containing protein [Paraburkholderia sp. Tr-20389]|uniref:transporter substrate-binding domain-containing protein n=1 Tax=Paraburkholderia sp. Tr-20389 TaxID=2703903 RepID=UPI0019825F7F|nr:transporter substrate-binding domain-containing protein [Paraburkholderia sp. Tr-20389]MBN3755998.1 transporter substrate-binding domain-containing protein [Paraburkholderia sp. Tr-20389]